MDMNVDTKKTQYVITIRGRAVACGRRELLQSEELLNRFESSDESVLFNYILIKFYSFLWISLCD